MVNQPGLTNVCRFAATLPSVLGSFCIMLVLFGWLGAGDGSVLLGWLGLSVALLTARGERAGVRIGCGFRRLSAQEAAMLTPLWARALAHADLREDQVDLYVHPSRAVNAFASGARSIAVTQGALDACRVQRLQEAHFVAILVHEIGHLETRSSRYSLAAASLTAPLRLLACTIKEVGLTGAARQPRRLLALGGVAGCVATARAVQDLRWATAFVLQCLPLAALVSVLLGAALRRHDEYAADRFAAQVGVGGDLRGALEALNGESNQRSWFIQMASRHPDPSARIERLTRRAGGAVLTGAESDFRAPQTRPGR